MNGFGQYDGLIAIIAPALGPEGVAHLKTLVEELGRTPVPVPPKSERQAVGWGSDGTTMARFLCERLCFLCERLCARISDATLEPAYCETGRPISGEHVV